MNPDNIPFNALIVGARNCGKTSFLVEILSHEFLQKFYYIFLVCPTYIHNKTYDGFAENDRGFFVIIPEQDQINDFLKLISFAFEGTNTLIILDDCAGSKDVKIKTNELVNLGFSARHKGISVWVVTQQMTSIAKAFRENIACLVLFYSPSAKDMKVIFKNYAGDLTNGEAKRFLKKLKEVKYSHLDFSLRHPFEIKMHD